MDTAKLYENATLAEASYANLSNVQTRDELIIALRTSKFSLQQATDLAALWSVRYHQANTTSGFSSTLFQSTSDANTYVYALRGTEPFTYGDLSADVGDIVTDGVAIKQIIDLYNDVAWMRAGVGQTYQAA